MGTVALPLIIVFLLVFMSWRVVYGSNRDLVRAKAWPQLFRRAMPFIVLTVMALSLFVIQGQRENQELLLVWAIVFAAAVIAANLFSIPQVERRANKAFRQGDYEAAAEHYRKLAEEEPLARNYAFLGAALGASGRDEEGIEASTRAIEKDPQYGIAYYNRGLIQRRMNRRSRAKKDLNRALEADLPRRFRSNVKGLLEELNK